MLPPGSLATDELLVGQSEEFLVEGEDDTNGRVIGSDADLGALGVGVDWPGWDRLAELLLIVSR